jgi:hypothetical protein
MGDPRRSALEAMRRPKGAASRKERSEAQRSEVGATERGPPPQRKGPVARAKPEAR